MQSLWYRLIAKVALGPRQMSVYVGRAKSKQLSPNNFAVGRPLNECLIAVSTEDDAYDLHLTALALGARWPVTYVVDHLKCVS